MVAIVAAVALSTGRAVAGPPFVTDDPVPTDDRHWEIYAGYQLANDPADASLLDEPFAEFNYGAMPNVQVSFSTLPEFGIKTRFVQEAHGWPQISFYPSVALPTTAGDHAVPFLPVWMQKSFGPWTAFGGGGIYLNRGPGQREYSFVGGALERDVNPQLTVGAEIFHESASTIGGRDTTGANVGLIEQIGALHAILFSAGRGLGPTDTFTGYASYEFELGPGTDR